MLVIVYCDDERLSRNYADILTQRGTENVYLLTGGLRAFAGAFPEQVCLDMPPSLATSRASLCDRAPAKTTSIHQLVTLSTSHPLYKLSLTSSLSLSFSLSFFLPFCGTALAKVEGRLPEGTQTSAPPRPRGSRPRLTRDALEAIPESSNARMGGAGSSRRGPVGSSPSRSPSKLTLRRPALNKRPPGGSSDAGKVPIQKE